MPSNVNVPAHLQRQRRVRVNYGLNASGKFVRKKAFRVCDYTPEGQLRQFDDEAGFIAFEEERYSSGQHQAQYCTKVRSTVPREQLAVEYIKKAEAMQNDAAMEEGHQTRVHMDQTAEDLHERHDAQDAMLQEIRSHQLGDSDKQLELIAKKTALAEK